MARAQDALHNAQSQEALSTSRHRAIENQPYTIRWADLKLLAEASLECEWNNNVNLARSDPEEDVILRPAVEVTGFWPVTGMNAVNFSLDIGYEEYFEHQQYSRLFVTPGSELSWDFVVDDWQINVHDRMSYEHEPITYGNVSGVARIGGLFNTAGMGISKDLDVLLLTIGYDHVTFNSSSSFFEFADRASDFGVGRASVRINDFFGTGLESAGGLTDYEQGKLNDFYNVSAGAFADWQLTPHLDLKSRAGYVDYFNSHSSSTALRGQAPDFSTYYLELTLNHRFTPHLSYALQGGHEALTSIDGALVSDWFASLNVLYQIRRNISLQAGLRYENATASLNQSFPDYDRILASLSLSYEISRKLRALISYQIVVKRAQSDLLAYNQSRISVGVDYRF